MGIMRELVTVAVAIVGVGQGQVSVGAVVGVVDRTASVLNSWVDWPIRRVEAVEITD